MLVDVVLLLLTVDRPAAFRAIRGDLRSVGVSPPRPCGAHSNVRGEGVLYAIGFAALCGVLRTVVLFVNSLLDEFEPLELLGLCSSLILLFLVGRRS